MRKEFLFLLIVLVALHHDFWLWNDSTLVGDWMPIGLAYHIVLSIVAAAFWLIAVKAAWPVKETPQSEVSNDTAAAAGEGSAS